ncbi:MAG: glycosyltransferase family 9 protein [Lewinellaceae bacterium]|nr:glycosyltransferase family 9 protein [Lewinellaceae bacterium]
MKILIIQTAFLGDVVLATPLVEKLHRFFPEANIDFLLRKGNEGLLEGHPLLHSVLVWNKKNEKYRTMLRMLLRIRQEQYDLVVNCQRFAAAGLLTALSGARQTIGFDKNPLSRFFTRRLPHNIGDGGHEVDRNLSLIAHLTDASPEKPKLYPSPAHYAKAKAWTDGQRYVCIAPTSVWFTKQWPIHKWAELIQLMPADCRVLLLGAPADRASCDILIADTTNRGNVFNLAGELSLIESAALMAGAAMNYVNDSAPLHLASATNAPVCAIFCSTIPSFGFGPLSDHRSIVETTVSLDCRPCGLHGYKACPKGHFACAEGIDAATFPMPK